MVERHLQKKSLITLCEKSRCEFAVAVSRKNGSFSTRNKIAPPRHALIGSTISIAHRYIKKEVRTTE